MELLQIKIHAVVYKIIDFRIACVSQYIFRAGLLLLEKKVCCVSTTIDLKTEIPASNRISLPVDLQAK